jgi:predicted small lipoprotein YifL
LRLVTVLVVFLLAGCGKKEPEAPVDDTATPAAESAVDPEKINQPVPPQEATLSPDELTRNPFLSAEEESEFRDAGKAVPLETLALSAILYSSADKSKAILQGRILEKGDTIGDKEIVEIRPEAVILKDAATEYIVRLRNL